MKRLASTLLVALSSTFLIPLQVNAFETISITVSRPNVAFGSKTVITPSFRTLDADTNYWEKFKYEVLTSPGALVDFTLVQGPSQSCIGTVIPNNSSYRSCVGQIGQKVILEAGNAGSLVSNSTLTLSVSEGQAVDALVMGWIDLNGDGRVSPLEPKTPQRSIRFDSITNLAGTINFEVDPPSQLTAGFSGWISNAAGREGWGKGLDSVADIENFKVFVESCVTEISPCTTSSYSPSFSPHPQLLSYRFTMEGAWVENEITKVRLAYFSSDDHFQVLRTVQFDYRGTRPAQVQTQLSAEGSESEYTGLESPVNTETFSALLDTQQTFSYSVVFASAEGEPLANELVQIRLDASRMATTKYLYVDGKPINRFVGGGGTTDQTRDETWLQRRTGEDGNVTLQLVNLQPVIGESLAISSRLRGFDAHQISSSGAIQRVYWTPSERDLAITTALDASSTSLTLTAHLIGPRSFGSNPPLVEFISSDSLFVEDSFKYATGTGLVSGKTSVTAVTKVRVALRSFESGSEEITIRARINGQVIERKVKIKFDGLTGVLERPASSVEVDASKVTIGSFNSKIVVYLKDLVGKRVSIKFGNKWRIVTPKSARIRVLFPASPGTTVKTLVYVDGQLVASESVVSRR